MELLVETAKNEKNNETDFLRIFNKCDIKGNLLQ